MNEFKSNFSGRIAALLAAGAMVFGMGASAQAASLDSVVPSVTVKYGDLNLDTDAGVHTLYRRLVAAARNVCPDGDNRNLSLSVKLAECRREAVARAVDSVGNTRLAAVFAASGWNG